MEKKLTLLSLFFLLTGCYSNHSVACIYSLQDKEVILDINAINDDITSIHERTSFVVPTEVLMNEERLNFLKSQLDNTYHFEDNLLVKERDLDIDDTYSLERTLKYLKTKRFICE